MTQSVGIIGHGLTGITAAIMLARAGYQVDLIGPRPEFAGGLQLAPNGLAALQSLGHYEAVRKKAVRLESIRITAMGDGRSPEESAESFGVVAQAATNKTMNIEIKNL